jgi:hypothetical protein
VVADDHDADGHSQRAKYCDTRSALHASYDAEVRRLLLALPLLAAGCGATGQQAVAVDAVARIAPDTKVSCTRAAHVGYLREVRTKKFLCIAKKGANDCDHYAVVVHDNGTGTATRTERDGECILPAS